MGIVSRLGRLVAGNENFSGRALVPSANPLLSPRRGSPSRDAPLTQTKCQEGGPRRSPARGRRMVSAKRSGGKGAAAGWWRFLEEHRAGGAGPRGAYLITSPVATIAGTTGSSHGSVPGR